MSLKPLGIVTEIVESAGMGISYAYEDLVFLEHNAFLLEFTANDKELLVHTNSEAEESEVKDSIARLKNVAVAHGMTFTDGGLYTLTQADDENIRIDFF
ncbi:MAG: hypothetical protein NTY00_04390 [Deltaproteobacteria bacterium]|nr:hypothetical protein [Deltaproteobacteria bacterium]